MLHYEKGEQNFESMVLWFYLKPFMFVSRNERYEW